MSRSPHRRTAAASPSIAAHLPTAVEAALVIGNEAEAPALAALAPVLAPRLAAVDDAWPDGGFDLILVLEGVDRGGLADIQSRLVRIGTRLSPSGRALLHIPTFAAPIGDGPEAYDRLLFPEPAAAGDLGDDIARRAMLPASAWRLLIAASGLRIVAAQGEGEHKTPEQILVAHAERLTAFDAQELETAMLTAIVEPAKP